MNRKPLLGVRNVVRFNWHFFALALAAIILLVILGSWFPILYLAAILVTSTILLSLTATAIAYDFSGLYNLEWLAAPLERVATVANIHSGFDETSARIKTRKPSLKLSILDFYDPSNHTEVSIRRARRAHPPAPQTIAFDTAHIPLDSDSTELVLLTLSAHEIRDPEERVVFFREVRRILKPMGQVLVTEHLRDFPNILAYNIGAWHFHSREDWLTSFSKAGLEVVEETKRNPFITTFTLRQHETST